MSDRKYKQSGYQDSGDRDRPARGPQGPQGPREKKEGPRGRGLGAPTETVFRCSACGEKRPFLNEIPLDAACASCGAALHSCINCVSFDTSVHWECRRWEELPARPARKNAANECALFAPKAAQEFGQEKDKEREKSKPGDARSAFDALFKF